MAIKNLIFDFGKVLVDYDFKAFLLSITKDEERMEEFFKMLSDEDFITQSDLGIIAFPQLIANMQKEFPQWHDELQEFIDRIYLSLPDKVTNIFKMSRQEGLTYNEIAQMMGVTPKVVEYQVSIALKAFRLKIGMTSRHNEKETKVEK